MLTVYRRHSPKCRHKSRNEKRCKCPVWVQGSLRGIWVKKSLKLRSWEAAQNLVRTWESEGTFEPEEKKVAVSIERAIGKFKEDLIARHLVRATIKKYDFLLNALDEFGRKKGFWFIQEFDAEAVSEFRATWKDAALSGYKKLERLRAFFAFCTDREYLKANPVRKLKPPKVRPTKVQIFTPEELEKLVWSCDLFPRHGIYGEGNRKRLKAFVLVLRYTGLRIGDVVALKRERVQDGRVFLHTAKTGTPVFLPLPPQVLEALGEIPNLGSFFFWSENGELRSSVSDWQRSLASSAEFVGSPKACAHISN